jgi:GR25 family glycosyltransferase involved in LPS biosynthesis
MKKYLINLDKRTDKLETVTQELNRVGIKNWVRFPAVDTTDGKSTVARHKGCVMSHLSVLNMAPKKGTFAIFEDDVMFLDGWKHTLLNSMRQLPDNWDALWLGSTLTQDLTRYSDNLFILKGGWTSHAILWNNRNGVVDYILNRAEDAQKIDVFYADRIQREFNCYITYPMMVGQNPGYSDIIRRETDYSVIQDWYNKHIKL